MVSLSLPSRACVDGARELVREARAIGEIGERILVRQLEDALFALGDAAAHVIEAGRQHADLVRALAH